MTEPSGPARRHLAEELLQAPTHASWARVAADDLDATLADHAHCEKKASASALALINDYPEDAELVTALARLAEEEIGHFRQVHERLCARGVALPRDKGDPYARALLKLVRPPNDERKLDRLLVCALIEARSCERFCLLRQELSRRGQDELADWLRRLEGSEAGHASLFVKLAEGRFGQAATERLAQLAALEAKLVSELPTQARVH
ncbi:MAG TPA: tRNA isopentenyl-2-thiomethyl-A-37 hydroxylase MiaE [Polyangiaceae bacterium]|nr:tRNA isopentenyl-2-thiomethyl-A-37 hydroxylase MiaE [Polyangiaceae bacterium]